MSDKTSAPRGRYAKPRRRALSDKARGRNDAQASGREEVPSGLFENNDVEQANESYSGDYGYDESAAQDSEYAPETSGYETPAYESADYESANFSGADHAVDDLASAPPDYAASGAPSERGYEHDYLDRDGSQTRYRPEYDAARDNYTDDDEYEDSPAEQAYDDSPADEEVYQRRPLRERALPPPPANTAVAPARIGVEAEGNLTVTGIGKSYKRRPVVRDVSLEVRRGEIVGLLGPNGAGKTTCFYMITGLIAADRGAIRLMGQDLTRFPMYQRARMGLSYLPQEVSIFRGMTVEQNIRAILELSEPSPHKREAKLDQLLAEFSISRLRSSPAIALSGGERRRVEIARALASNPSFILLDEPFAGVDPIAVGDIRSLVWQLKDRGIGVLITDHNVRETLEIIDRAYILHDGRVLMEGAPEDVINDENVRRVYLGEGFRI